MLHLTVFVIGRASKSGARKIAKSYAASGESHSLACVIFSTGRHKQHERSAAEVE